MEQYEERQTAYSDNQFQELRNLIQSTAEAQNALFCSNFRNLGIRKEQRFLAGATPKERLLLAFGLANVFGNLHSENSQDKNWLSALAKTETLMHQGWPLVRPMLEMMHKQTSNKASSGYHLIAPSLWGL
ncbi:hypothetical protein Lal_00001530, partial [Lupinus albus]